MKNLLLVALFVLVFAGLANAGWVSGYYRSNGTYVNNYYRTASDGIKENNISYQRKINWDD